MCGICGFAGNLSYDLENKVFRDMLDVCQVRGRDSTGVFKVRRDNSYTWAKNIGPPSNLADHRLYEQTLSGGSAKVMAGHCRSATIGGVSIKNAHPFDIGNEFIGCHNGTLKSHYMLDTHETSMVDSEVLMRHIHKHGAKKTFSEVEGAWACVWYDARDSTLNFIRNAERPLYLVRNKAADVLAWASEPWMFGALSRTTELGEIFSLSEDVWLSYHLPKDSTDIGKGKSKKIERKKSVLGDNLDFTGMYQGGNYGHHVQHIHRINRGVGGGGSNVTPFHIKDKKSDTTKDALDPFTKKPLVTIRELAGMEFITNAHTGKEYTKEKFLAKAGGHCCFCEKEITELKQVAEMFSEEYVICKGCFEECYGEEGRKKAN